MSINEKKSIIEKKSINEKTLVKLGENFKISVNDEINKIVEKDIALIANIISLNKDEVGEIYINIYLFNLSKKYKETNENKYLLLLTKLFGEDASDNIILCDLISKEPSNQSSNINGQSQFNVILNDTTAAYQWQSNPSNVGWVNLLSNSVYSGVATKMLKVSNVQVNNHKQLFRVIATKNTCKDTSVVAMLTVNDTCITSTTDTLYIKVNTSSVNNPIYNTLKVYPNPSSTHVIIDNGNYNTMGAYTAKIVNTAGQQVFQSFINQQQFTIDAKTLGGAGVYTLYITDALNKVVGVKKIVLQ